MLLVLSCNSMLCLLLHRLHEVLHVLERIDLERLQKGAQGSETTSQERKTV